MAVTKGRQFKRPRCCNGTGPGANPPPPPLPAWSLCAAGKNPNSGRLAAESRVPRLSPATDLGPGAALSLFSICKVDITTAPVPGVPGAWGGAPQMDTRDRQGPVCPLRPAIRAPHARPRPRSRRLRGQRASAGWARGPPHPPPPPPPGAHSPSEREVAARPPAGRKCSRAPPGRPRTLPGRSRSPEDRCLGDLGGGGRGASGAAGVGPRQAGPPHRYLTACLRPLTTAAAPRAWGREGPFACRGPACALSAQSPEPVEAGRPLFVCGARGLRSTSFQGSARLARIPPCGARLGSHTYSFSPWNSPFRNMKSSTQIILGGIFLSPGWTAIICWGTC